MSQAQEASPAVAAYTLSTAAFAELNLVQPQTVWSRLSTTGSYHGVVPKKLASRKLAWPAVQVGA